MYRILCTTEFAKYRKVGKFASSFWRSNAQRFTAWGWLRPL